MDSPELTVQVLQNSRSRWWVSKKARGAESLACIADGIVGAREITFWRRSCEKYKSKSKPPSSLLSWLRRSLLAAPRPKLYFARASARLQYRQLRRLQTVQITKFLRKLNFSVRISSLLPTCQEKLIEELSAKSIF